MWDAAADHDPDARPPDHSLVGVLAAHEAPTARLSGVESTVVPVGAE